MNNNPKKLSELWQNLIKRYSFMAFIVLPLAEVLITSIFWFLLRFDIKIFYLLQLLFFIINICTIVILYKKEEKFSKYIEYDFVLNNKFFGIILFITGVLGLYFNILITIFSAALIFAIPLLIEKALNPQISWILTSIYHLPKPVNMVILYPLFFFQTVYEKISCFSFQLPSNVIQGTLRYICMPLIHILGLLYNAVIKFIIFIGQLIMAVVVLTAIIIACISQNLH